MQQALERSQTLLDDVKAPEFREPGATADDGSAGLHPRSILARFSQWRSRFPSDYNAAWGGLALASTCDFWVRKEVLECAFFDISKVGLENLHTQVSLHDYASDGLTSDSVLGGDDELIETSLQLSVLPTLLRFAEASAYDACDHAQTKGLALQLGELLNTGGNVLKAPCNVSFPSDFSMTRS